MKSQLSMRAFVLAAGVAAMVVMLGCKQASVNYDKFEQRTIEANLAAIDSARVLYHAQLVAGSIDAAAQQACQFLLTQPGVDTAEISPDSTVWAFFASGLLAGTGRVQRPGGESTDAKRQTPNREPAVRAASGGEVFDVAHYVLPFNTELPGTQQAADALIGIFKHSLNWQSDSMYTGSEVDLEMALNLIKNGNSVIYWSGHGTIVPPDSGLGVFYPGLVLGRSYAGLDSASAAVLRYAGYLDPGAGKTRQAAVVLFTDDSTYHVVILPGFIRAHGNFDADEGLPGYNLCKTVVMLSCCYSAFSSTSAPGDLLQAFRSVGADVVCGYDWAVYDDFACDKDTTFLKAMADTCFAGEALMAIGNRVDPLPSHNHQAVFTMVGDSTVMLAAVLQARKDGALYQACPAAAAVIQSDNTMVLSTLHTPGSFDPVDYVNVTFPGTSGGTFDVTSTDGASITWANYAGAKTWYAEKDFQGVSGTIQIDSCDGGYVLGSFSGTLGWWNPPHVPTTDPPDEVITITEGRIKHTGKLANSSALGPLGHVAQGISGKLR